MSLLGDKIVAGILKIEFEPQFFKDNKYKVWLCALSPTTCKPCFDLNGKLFLPQEAPPERFKLHDRCRCYITWAKSVKKVLPRF